MTKTQEIRELARQVADIAHSTENNVKRKMWALHNDMKWTGPAPVLISLDQAWREILPKDCLGVAEPVYRLVEMQLRKKLWYASLNSDMVIEPWVDMNAVYFDDTQIMWGVEMQFSEIGDSTVFHGEIERPEDIDRMHVPFLRMDGTRTCEMFDRASELLDGYLDVRVEWRHRHLVTPNFGVWTIQFMGLERFMLWCADKPGAVDKFMCIMAQTYIQHNRDIEKRMRLADNNCFINDFYPWHGIPAKSPRLSDMWVHSDSQEFHLISAEMLERFLFAYIRPIFSMFGRGSFGCCESLNKKMELVKTLPNLRRVTISECTNWDGAIKALGNDYVYSVRPVLVNTLYVNDEEKNRQDIRRMAETFRGLHWEINLPGGSTLRGDPNRFHKLVSIMKEEVSN